MEEVSVVYDKDLKEEIQKFEEHSAELLKSKYLFETNTKYSLEQLRFAPQNEPIIISLREFVKAYQEQLITDSDRKNFMGWPGPDILDGEDFFDNFLIEELQNRSLKFISEELLKLDRILESKRRDLHLYHLAISKPQLKVKKQEREIVCDAMYEILKTGPRLDMGKDDLYKEICCTTNKNFDNVKKTFTSNMLNIRFEHPVKALWEDRERQLKNNKKINKLSRSKKMKK